MTRAEYSVGIVQSFTSVTTRTLWRGHNSHLQAIGKKEIHTFYSTLRAYWRRSGSPRDEAALKPGGWEHEFLQRLN